MPTIVFFDNDPYFRWHENLALALQMSRTGRQIGDVTVTRESDRLRIKPVMQASPDIVFIDLDWGQTWRDGIPLIRVARKMEPTVPIFVLTDARREDTSVFEECIEAGATSFWNKQDDNLGNLVQRVEEALLTIRPALKRAEQLRRIANPDVRAWQVCLWLNHPIADVPTPNLREASQWLHEALLKSRGNDCPTQLILESVMHIAAELLHREPHDLGNVETLADAHFHAGRWVEAEAEYKRLTAAGPHVWKRLSVLAALRNEPEVRDRLRVEYARALATAGSPAEAAEVYSSIDSEVLHDEVFHLDWISCARAAGQDVTPIVREWLRRRHAAGGAEAATLLRRHVMANSRPGITAHEVGAALSGLASEAPEFIDGQLDVLQSMYCENDREVTTALLDTIDLERIPTPAQLMDVAEIAATLGKNEVSRKAVNLAWFQSGATTAETEVIIKSAIQLADSTGDAPMKRELTRRLWHHWAELGVSREEELARDANDWITEHPADFASRELAADLLITCATKRLAGVSLLADLVVEPQLQSEDDTVRRLMRKLALLRDEREAREVYAVVAAAWQQTGKRLSVDALEKPLRGLRIVLAGGRPLEALHDPLDALLTNNGAKTTWRTSFSTRNRAELIPTHADLCVVHLGMGHSDWYKVREALERVHVPYVEVPKDQGVAGVRRAIERHFGRLASGSSDD
jgi:DNA-binding NarL/FixJ family response regulator